MAQKTTSTARTRPASAKREQERARRSVPVLVPQMHVRHLPVRVPAVPSVRVPVPGVVRDRLPDGNTNRALWWGGLAVLAAAEVISWPVAGVVAAGSYVAERQAKDAVQARATNGKRAGQGSSRSAAAAG